LRPQRVEERIVGDQSPGVLDEIPEHGKSLGCEKNALLSQAITTPEALVDGVEPERRKLSHRSTNRVEKSFCGDEIGGSESLGEAAVDGRQQRGGLVRPGLLA